MVNVKPHTHTQKPMCFLREPKKIRVSLKGQIQPTWPNTCHQAGSARHAPCLSRCLVDWTVRVAHEALVIQMGTNQIKLRLPSTCPVCLLVRTSLSAASALQALPFLVASTWDPSPGGHHVLLASLCPTISEGREFPRHFFAHLERPRPQACGKVRGGKVRGAEQRKQIHPWLRPDFDQIQTYGYQLVGGHLVNIIVPKDLSYPIMSEGFLHGIYRSERQTAESKAFRHKLYMYIHISHQPRPPRRMHSWPERGAPNP